MAKKNVGTCSKCKQKDVETRQVHSFRICKKCFPLLPERLRGQYPVW